MREIDSVKKCRVCSRAQYCNHDNPTNIIDFSQKECGCRVAEINFHLKKNSIVHIECLLERMDQVLTVTDE